MRRQLKTNVRHNLQTETEGFCLKIHGRQLRSVVLQKLCTCRIVRVVGRPTAIRDYHINRMINRKCFCHTPTPFKLHFFGSWQKLQCIEQRTDQLKFVASAAYHNLDHSIADLACVLHKRYRVQTTDAESQTTDRQATGAAIAGGG